MQNIENIRRQAAPAHQRRALADRVQRDAHCACERCYAIRERTTAYWIESGFPIELAHEQAEHEVAHDFPNGCTGGTSHGRP